MAEKPTALVRATARERPPGRLLLADRGHELWIHASFPWLRRSLILIALTLASVLAVTATHHVLPAVAAIISLSMLMLVPVRDERLQLGHGELCARRMLDVQRGATIFAKGDVAVRVAEVARGRWAVIATQGDRELRFGDLAGLSRDEAEWVAAKIRARMRTG